jgi:hypothetical protein
MRLRQKSVWVSPFFAIQGRGKALNKTLLVFVFVLLSGCVASTPDGAREQCLAHEAPHAAGAGQTAETVAGAFLTLGINVAVNNSRTMADCSEILGDETLRQSCPARVTWCEQYFAERRNAAGATRIQVRQTTVNQNY